MKKIAFVVQRFGEDMGGGAEMLCFEVVKVLSSKYEIEVLTTCAKDYTTWENHFKPGVEKYGDFTIRRFKTDRPRDFEKFSEECGPFFQKQNITKKEAEEWLIEQGPVSPDLEKYIDDHSDDYDAFVFYTYLYATTYFNLPKVKDKAILVSTAHDELPIHLPIWKDFFKLPQKYIFLTPEEGEMLTRLFGIPSNKHNVIGYPFDYRECVGNGENFKKKYKVDDYIFSIGRIDAAKGYGTLFEFFKRYKKRNKSNLKLIIAGKQAMEIPSDPDIIYLGYISDEDKFDAMAGSRLFINPSGFESLSIVLLEAWANNKPVLVNAASEVTVGQCKRSNSGLWYSDYWEFEACIRYLLDHHSLGSKASRFIDEYYAPEVIKSEYSKVIESVV